MPSTSPPPSTAIPPRRRARPAPAMPTGPSSARSAAPPRQPRCVRCSSTPDARATRWRSPSLLRADRPREFTVHVRRTRANRFQPHCRSSSPRRECRAVLTATVVTAPGATPSASVASAPEIRHGKRSRRAEQVALSWTAQYEFRFVEWLLALTDSPRDGHPAPRCFGCATPPRPLDSSRWRDERCLFAASSRCSPIPRSARCDDHLLPCPRRRAPRPRHGALAGVADAGVFHRSSATSRRVYGAGGQLLATAARSPTSRRCDR